MSNNKDFLLKNAVEVGGPTKVTLGSITSSDIDLATGNYFADTLAANTTYTISNAGDVQAFQLEVTGGFGSQYDLANAVYDGVSFSVASEETAPTSLFFKPDGTKMYVLGQAADDINEYDLSTAWDVSTASYLQVFSVAAQDTAPTSLFFKPDGTKMYVLGETGDDVNEYDLSTAWDISTASYLQRESISAQETDPSGLFFKSDGTKMYVSGKAGDDVNEYNLSTAWDVSTSSFVQSFSFAAKETNPNNIFFSADGTNLYILGLIGDDITEYSLSTAWDVSTASYVQEFSVAAQEANAYGLFFKPDGTKMYIVGVTNDTIYQYSTAVATTITWPSSIEWNGGTAPETPAIGETDLYTFLTDDSGTSYVGLKTADNIS